MSYGHAEKVAAIAAREIAAADRKKPVPPIDPRLYDDPDVRRILAEHDIAALYVALKDDGRLTQRTIAELVGMNQSEVSEILDGRRVLSYDLLVRIAKGLSIPRELMGLSWWCPDGTYAGPGDTYAGGVTVASPEEVAAMLRRHVLALAPIAALAHNPLVKLAELLERSELPRPSPVPLPSQVSGVHVVQVRDLTRRLSEAGCTYGSDPEVSSAAAARTMRLLNVPGPEPVKRALKSAVAQLHIHAGWAGFDSGLYDRAMHHYAHALELATEAGDAYCQTYALNCAGLATVEHSDPNEGLTMLQFAGVKALDVPSDLDPSAIVTGPRSRAALKACSGADSATALSRLDYPEVGQAADTALAKSRELWQPTKGAPNGDLDSVAAHIELDRGHLDVAESFAVASVRRWDGVSERARTQSAIVLATIYVRAGEPRGLQLAHGAVTAAARLTSVRARKRLQPLVAALGSRPGSDYQESARMARQVAATRA